MGNPLLIIQMISKDSRCFQNFVAICGGDKAAQEMVASIAGMILEMAIFFPLMILSGGGAAPMEVADAVHHALNISLTTATRLCKAASVAFQALMASLEVSRSGMQINNSVLQAQMEIIKGTADAYNEEAQATVQMLKKLIQKLLDIMNGRAEFILDLGKFQAKKYNDSSNILTELFSPEIAS
jgi:hypothetical protein